MNRSARMELAQATLEVLERQQYRSASGRTVDTSATIDRCLERTRYFTAGELESSSDRATLSAFSRAFPDGA